MYGELAIPLLDLGEGRVRDAVGGQGRGEGQQIDADLGISARGLRGSGVGQGGQGGWVGRVSVAAEDGIAARVVRGAALRAEEGQVRGAEVLRAMRAPRV